jgi:hypothetical protein
MLLLLGDCLEILPAVVASASVNAVICDLPYGTTQNKWDSIIPLESLWKEYRRVCKGPIILTAAQPFTSALVMSNLAEFKYSWIWQKEAGTGLLNAKKQPLRDHEDVLCFYKTQCIYNPQFSEGKPYKQKKGGETSNYNPSGTVITENDGFRYPKTVLQFTRDRDKKHPTQKPVALMEYLIRTYTNERDVVLDNCMGSGTTGVACVNTNREFIGIEKDINYFRIARERILEAQFQKRIRDAERLVSR